MALIINGRYDMSASILSEVKEVERHLHNRERWFGKTAVQTATDWGTLTSLLPFTATSGLGDFGADANDEAQVLGADNTPAIAGMVKFDLHHIMVSDASNATEFVMRIVWGTGTMAAAQLAGQFSNFMLTDARKGASQEVLMPRIAVGTKVWVRLKNATDNATVDFFIGLHEYEE